MKKSKYTPEIVEFLTHNYPVEGPEFCAAHLGGDFTAQGIISFCQRARIRKALSSTSKPKTPPNFDIEDFTNITKPIVAYYLGLIWGDGHLIPNVGLDLRVREDDGDEFYRMIKVLGKFALTSYTEKTYGTKVKGMRLNFKKLAVYLQDLDFGLKSTVSPTKILSKIPIDLHKFFWLGFLDADGCFFVGDGDTKLDFSGSYNQDWTDLIKCLDSLRVFSQYRQADRGEKGRESSVSVYSRFDINQVGEYLYSTYEQDGIGLPRKYQKYLQIKDHCYRPSIQAAGFRGVQESKKNTKGFSTSFGVVIKYSGKFLRKFGFKDAKDAAVVYDEISVECAGHRAHTNFPISNYMKLGVPNYVIPKNPAYSSWHWQIVPFDGARYKVDPRG